jgi:hypothetical protein
MACGGTALAFRCNNGFRKAGFCFGLTLMIAQKDFENFVLFSIR